MQTILNDNIERQCESNLGTLSSCLIPECGHKHIYTLVKRDIDGLHKDKFHRLAPSSFTVSSLKQSSIQFPMRSHGSCAMCTESILFVGVGFIWLYSHTIVVLLLLDDQSCRSNEFAVGKAIGKSRLETNRNEWRVVDHHRSIGQINRQGATGTKQSAEW